jgi:hypothetical protein
MHRQMMPMDRNEDPNNIDITKQMFEKVRAETTFEILGSNKFDTKKMNMSDVTGLTIQMDMINDVLIYKLKIALRKSVDNDIAIGILNSNHSIGICLETAEIDKDKMKEGFKGNRKGDNNPGDKGPPPGRNGQGREMKRDIPEQLKYSCVVKLASNITKPTGK